MTRNSLNIAPGKKLCKPCKQKIARKEDLTEEEQSQDEDFLISPLKSHSKSSKHILSEGMRKIALINEMANNASRKIEYQCSSKLCYETNGMKKRAENFDEIMSLTKEKIYVLTKELLFNFQKYK